MEHVRPMLKTAWASMLAAFSIALKDRDDQEGACNVVGCLFGLRASVDNLKCSHSETPIIWDDIQPVTR